MATPEIILHPEIEALKERVMQLETRLKKEQPSVSPEKKSRNFPPASRWVPWFL